MSTSFARAPPSSRDPKLKVKASCNDSASKAARVHCRPNLKAGYFHSGGRIFFLIPVGPFLIVKSHLAVFRFQFWRPHLPTTLSRRRSSGRGVKCQKATCKEGTSTVVTFQHFDVWSCDKPTFTSTLLNISNQSSGQRGPSLKADLKADYLFILQKCDLKKKKRTFEQSRGGRQRE